MLRASVCGAFLCACSVNDKIRENERCLRTQNLKYCYRSYARCFGIKGKNYKKHVKHSVSHFGKKMNVRCNIKTLNTQTLYTFRYLQIQVQVYRIKLSFCN